MSMSKASKKPVRLLFASACLLLMSACDLSGGGSVATPLLDPVPAPSPAVPAPPADSVFDGITFIDCNEQTIKDKTCTTDAQVSGDSIAKAAAAVDARIKLLQTGITVTVTGNADRRCTPAKTEKCSQGKYLKARSGGFSPQNEGWSKGRSKTVTEDLQNELKNNPGKYPNYAGLASRETIKWNRESLGETNAQYSDTTCNKKDDPCADDRATGIKVSSSNPSCSGSACTTTTTSTTVCGPPCTTRPPTTTTTTSTTTTSTTTTTTPPPPPPPPAAVTQVVRAFQNAQQNSDQRIVVKAATIVCAGCQQPPSSTSGVLYGWTATLDSGTVSFTLTPPAGYATPRDYRITSNPSGKSALSDQTAVLRFYTATRSGMPYRYLATANVSYTMRLWRLEGTTLTYVRQESRSASPTLTCSPSSCSFGVLGSNVG
jgi:hypothetical protein